MPKLTIQDVFKMFEPFGISVQKVTKTLNACEDRSAAFNAFEGLKCLVTLRYEEMRGGDVSLERFKEVKPTYERLMSIQLKNYTPPKKKEPEKKKDPKKSASSNKDTLSDLIDEMKMRKSKSFQRMSDWARMMKEKDADGLMKLLDPDGDPATEREALDILIRKFHEDMGKEK